MKKFDYEKVEKIIGYKFNNKHLLKQAFFRSSFAHENNRESNEVLEFIGDKVLDLAVMRILLEKYAKPNKGDEYFKSNKQEGELTNIKSEIVSTGYLAGTLMHLGLDKYIYYGKSDLLNDVKEVRSVKEDVFEAIIGAIALDSNWNMTTIIKIVKKWLNTDTYLKESDINTNYVGRVQERAFQLGLDNIEYNLTLERQGDEMVWHATLSIKGIKQKTDGYGYKQKEAKKDAAMRMIPYLMEYEDKLVEMRAKQDSENVFDVINSLVQAEVISKPEYEFDEDHDDDGNPFWKCTTVIDELDYVYFGFGSSKKEAQRDSLKETIKGLRKAGFLK